MTKFLDKKEQVIDFQLTPLGRRKLATGKLKPTYYSFYDDGVIYDSEYAGFSEDQNSIHPRIKNETSYTKGILSFEEIETSTPPGNYLEVAYDDLSVAPYDIDISPDKNILQANKFLFDSAIGDAQFEGENTQAAPAWKVVTCQGEIISSATRDTAAYDNTHVVQDIEAREFNIPQLNVELYYSKLIDKPSTPLEFSSVSDSITETQTFADGYSVKLVKDDMVVYAEEMNTQLLTENFEIEVFEIEETEGEITPSTGTIKVLLNGGSNAFYGRTLTISDGETTATFEFVADGGSPTAGNVGVIVPASFQYLGVSGVTMNHQAVVYNLIAAIDNTFDNKYPTENWYLGSNSDGSAAENRGKCLNLPDSQPRCVVNSGHNDLNVSINKVPVIRTDAATKDSVEFTIVNNNPCTGDMGLITTDYPDVIEVSGFGKCLDTKITKLQRKFFEKEIPHIVDGIMKSSNPEQNLNTELNTDAVEYYFDVLTDTSVDAKIACECASTFNKNSYYIDIDFDEEVCKEADETLYFDIYGSVTVPEICDDGTGDGDGDLQPCGDEE